MEDQNERELHAIKESIASNLIGALGRSSGEPAAVRENAVLALDLLGDVEIADDLVAAFTESEDERDISSRPERHNLRLLLGL